MFEIGGIAHLCKLITFIHKSACRKNSTASANLKKIIIISYYACLCGHVELVEYLLDSGARCEAQTFDGERILYGALTNEIRNKLKNYKVVTSHIVIRDEYEEFLRK